MSKPQAKQTRTPADRALLVDVERTPRPDGYDARLHVRIEQTNGDVAHFLFQASLTDQPDGCCWTLDIVAQGEPSAVLSEVPPRMESRVTYGDPVPQEPAPAQQSGKKVTTKMTATPRTQYANAIETTTVYADGRRDTQTSIQNMPVPPRPNRELGEFRRRFEQFAQGKPFDAARPYLAFVDPLSLAAVLGSLFIAQARMQQLQPVHDAGEDVSGETTNSADAQSTSTKEGEA